MIFYADHIVPLMIELAMRNREIARRRPEIVAQAAGRVLELGVGSGFNLPLYRDVVGVVGLTGRAAVVALLGYLLLRASLEHDPQEAAGVDEALRSLVDEAYGRWVVTAIAVGLACYGLYSWIEARYRRL